MQIIDWDAGEFNELLGEVGRQISLYGSYVVKQGNRFYRVSNTDACVRSDELSVRQLGQELARRKMEDEKVMAHYVKHGLRPREEGNDE